METLRFTTRIGSDGILKIAAPVSVRDVDCEVVVVYAVTRRPRRTTGSRSSMRRMAAWPMTRSNVVSNCPLTCGMPSNELSAGYQYLHPVYQRSRAQVA